ncbi:MAG: PilT/PilU family type 4a pilus ATPase [Hungatella sp.]|nr:PilT/PilU family type 4a pilus ATPase [Hungatella sp.]
MDIRGVLQTAVDRKASDIFIVAGMPLSYKVGGIIEYQEEDKLSPVQIEKLIEGLYEEAQHRSMKKIQEEGDDDFSFAIKDLSRFRANVFRQRGSLAAIIRVITFELPNYEQLHLPRTIIDVAKMTKGLVLVTGPAGSGKSTTLACIINEINKTRNAHVITLEDPIEYLHRHDKSVVSQREIGTDTESYVTGLRAALRQAPDVILLGEMRDYETIKTAMTAAETGHLVISTLHTVGAANTMDRIIDSFPPEQQQQIRVQISMVMEGVISQQLIPTLQGGVQPAFEIMFFNNAIRNMIRESKIHQIDNVIATSQKEGMVSMDASLIQLYQKGIISKDDAIIHSNNSELMAKKIERL